MKNIKLLITVILSLTIAAPAFAQPSYCKVDQTLTELDGATRLQKKVLLDGLKTLRDITQGNKGYATKSAKAAETAYSNSLNTVFNIPFEIQVCRENTACSKADFTSSLAVIDQASSRIKNLSDETVKKLARANKDERGPNAAKKLRKKANEYRSGNLNGQASLSALECLGGRGSVPTPNPTPKPTIDPDDNALLRTMAGHWNHVAINASGFDHSSLGGKEQLGPVRSARAMAIVHIAIFDAVNAATGQLYHPYLLQETRSGASVDAAIAQASYETLIKLFPSQASSFAKDLLIDLSKIPNDQKKADGVYLGKEAARLILTDRENDGSDALSQGVPYEFREGPGMWAIDPINPQQKPVGANWYLVRPFVIPNATIFRSVEFPPFESAAFKESYDEVKRLGGDGINTPTERTQDQTEAGVFWAYDGTPSLCAPPKLYNQVALHIANQQGMTDVVEITRMLALLNVSMADAGLTSWETKYHYSIARPITAIRKGNIDANPNTVGDANWTPLGAPASNLNGPNFTPPFPAYVSGHATFGGALFQVLRNAFGTDNIAFTFTSDEFNGITPGNDGIARPKKPRYFNTLSAAEEENGQSRIYLGIHWSFDKTEGIRMGRSVANYIHLNALRKK